MITLLIAAGVLAVAAFAVGVVAIRRVLALGRRADEHEDVIERLDDRADTYELVFKLIGERHRDAEPAPKARHLHVVP